MFVWIMLPHNINARTLEIQVVVVMAVLPSGV